MSWGTTREADGFVIGRARRPAWLAGLLLLSAVVARGSDTVTLIDGSEVNGTITSLAPNDVEVEAASGIGSDKISIAAVRDVRFGDEPESLSSARALLQRRDGPGAVAELAKIAAIELQEGVASPRAAGARVSEGGGRGPGGRPRAPS